MDGTFVSQSIRKTTALLTILLYPLPIPACFFYFCLVFSEFFETVNKESPDMFGRGLNVPYSSVSTGLSYLKLRFVIKQMI